MMPHHSLTRPESKNGFALVVSLSLMAFILLLLLSITALVRVENQSATIQQQQNEAQQNALLGLQMALGELQRTAGPDQRVTATADILDDTNIGKRNTVGVWASADSSPNDSSTFDKGDLLRWLTSDAVDTNQAANETYNEDPVTGNTITLVGAGSLPSTNGVLDNPDDAIVIDITNTTISKDNSTVGRYGWWVGDEGVKARVNLSRPQTGSTDAEAIKQRGVLNVGSNSINNPVALPNLNAIDFANDAESLQQLKDLELIPGGSADIAEDYFHHLTTVSAGVLADVKNGGLKKDLSLAFEMSDNDFDTSQLAAGNSDAIDAIGYTRGNVLPVFSFDAGDNKTAIGPVWNLLRQYYRLYQLVDSPMTAPTMNAQALGPSNGHSNPALHDTDDSYMEADINNNRTWVKQTAVGWGGGPAIAWALADGGREVYGNGWKAKLGFTNNGKSPLGPSDAIAQINSNTVLPMNQANGDPLLEGSGLPIMVESSYAPYLMRVIKTSGLAFETRGDNFQMLLGTKEIFVLHNPYNITLNHPDLSLEITTLNTSINHTIDTGGTIKINTGGELSRAYVRPDTLSPGKIKQYSGEMLRTKVYAESTELSPPSYHGIKFGWRNLGGEHSIANNAQFEVTPYAGTSIQSDSYNFTAFNVMSCMRGSHNTAVTGSNMQFNAGAHWPITSIATTTVVGPGINYNSSPPTGSDYRYKGLETVPITLASQLIPEGQNASSRQDLIKPLMTYDFQLRPSEFSTIDPSITARYPSYALTNPMAPIKDSKNLLALDDLLADSVGFAKFAPGWELTVTSATSFADSTQNPPDYDLWGPSDGDSFNTTGGVSEPVLLEIPTTPLQSLGQLQHANITLHAHMPALAISNSLASPYIPKEKVLGEHVSGREIFRNRFGHDRIFYDVSYLMNEALWDEYFFSSYSTPYDPSKDQYDNAPSANFNSEAQSVGETFDTAFGQNATGTLPNSRMQLILNESETTSDDAKIKLFESNQKPKEDSYLRSAENLIVAGAFNINSTSVEAWRALLSGARDQAIFRSASTSPEDLNGDTPFSRLSQPWLNQSDNDPASADTWAGFKGLDDIKIEALANAIVDEIKLRTNTPSDARQGGLRPYISLAEFVNRELADSDYGLCGVLQAAIDKSKINDSLVDGFNDVTPASLGSAATGSFPEPSNIETAGGTARSGGMAAPAHLLQADILQAIGSFISPRSDTFRVRSYGDSLDPLSREIRSKAWCEAIVQRIPSPVKPQAGTTPDERNYWSPTNSDGTPIQLENGRQFKIISFRWLSEDEV